jgi:hypothetical protein
MDETLEAYKRYIDTKDLSELQEIVETLDRDAHPDRLEYVTSRIEKLSPKKSAGQEKEPLEEEIVISELPLTLRTSRTPYILILAVVVLTAAGAGWYGSRHPGFVPIAICIGSVALAVFAMLGMRKPPTLTLSIEGFSVRSPLRSTSKLILWNDIEYFSMIPLGAMLTRVAYQVSKGKGKARMPGGMMLSSNFGLSAERLATLLEACRQAALNGTGAFR